MTISALASSLISHALAEHDALKDLTKGDPVLRAHIRTYGADTGIEIKEPVDSFHYSAVFISWCIKKAGATASQFAPVDAHWCYVKKAIANSDADTRTFHGLPIESHAPQPGDLIEWSRQGKISFERGRNGPRYMAHGGIVVAVDKAARIAKIVVGNDEASGTVTMREVKLNTDGFIVQRITHPFVCVIQTLL